MNKQARDQHSIVEMLARLCEEIRALEVQFHLFVGKGDFRPRIEYFHDAVRAYTKGDAAAREAGGRLCIEFLSYDVTALRYISSMPLAPLNPGHHHLSPSQGVMVRKPNSLADEKKATRADKARLSELYGRYGLLFVALLKPIADEDYRDRVEEMDEEVSLMSEVLQELEKLGLGKGTEQKVRNALAHAEGDNVKEIVNAVLDKQNYKNAGKLDKALKTVKGSIQHADKAIAGVEAAHMQYVTAQLGIYEQGKETLKALASSGLNLAGRFTEAASQQTERGRGR